MFENDVMSYVPPAASSRVPAVTDAQGSPGRICVHYTSQSKLHQGFLCVFFFFFFLGGGGGLRVNLVNLLCSNLHFLLLLFFLGGG